MIYKYPNWLVVLTILKNIKVNGKDDTFHFQRAARHCAWLCTMLSSSCGVCTSPMVVWMYDFHGYKICHHELGKLRRQVAAGVTACKRATCKRSNCTRLHEQWRHWGRLGRSLHVLCGTPRFHRGLPCAHAPLLHGCIFPRAHQQSAQLRKPHM
jgi:hypothetical protein